MEKVDNAEAQVETANEVVKDEPTQSIPTTFKITKENLDKMAKNLEELIPNKYLRVGIFQLINDTIEPM